MRKAIFKVLWSPWRAFERTTFPELGLDEEVFVVLGFPRSGTSFVARLLCSAGISFGDPSQFRPADWRNPEGFFEYVSMNWIDRALMREGGNTSQHAFSENGGIRAQGFWSRIKRFFTRFRMLRALQHIRTTGKRWAFKEFPASFYFWAPYVSSAKIIAVYRDPIETAYSESKSFGRVSFAQYIDEWTRAHEELLYHVGTRNSVVVALKDFAVLESRTRILPKLASFIGGDVSALEKCFQGQDRFQKTKADVEKLHSVFPLPERTKKVLAALDAVKLA